MSLPFPSRLDAMTAIEVDSDAGDRTCRVRCQVGGGLGDILWCGQPAERDRGYESALCFVWGERRPTH